MSGKVGVDNSENIALAPNAPRVAPKQIEKSLDDVKKAKDREAAKEAVAKASAKEKAKRRKERKKHGEPDYDSDEEATTTRRHHCLSVKLSVCRSVCLSGYASIRDIVYR